MHLKAQTYIFINLISENADLFCNNIIFHSPPGLPPYTQVVYKPSDIEIFISLAEIMIKHDHFGKTIPKMGGGPRRRMSKLNLDQ